MLLYFGANDLIWLFTTAIISEPPDLLVNSAEMSAAAQVVEGYDDQLLQWLLTHGYQVLEGYDLSSFRVLEDSEAIRRATTT